jgi:hypothetical protein
MLYSALEKRSFNSERADELFRMAIERAIWKKLGSVGAATTRSISGEGIIEGFAKEFTKEFKKTRKRLIPHSPDEAAILSALTVSDETDDEGRGVPGMKQSQGSGRARRATRTIGCERGWVRPNFIAVCLDETEDRAQQPRNLGNVG